MSIKPLSSLSPLERAQHYVANLTAAEKRGITITSAGQTVKAELTHYQRVVASLTAASTSAADATGVTSTAIEPQKATAGTRTLAEQWYYATQNSGSLAATPAATDPGPLSSDPAVAIHQILVAVGHPVQFNPDGSSKSLDPLAVLGDCNAKQNRELAMLGFWGPPPGNGGAAVDYSLFRSYYQETAPGSGNWEPKPEYASSGTWQAYVAGPEQVAS